MLIATMLAYLVALLAIGFWAQKRTQDTADFHLAGRRLCWGRGRPLGSIRCPGFGCSERRAVYGTALDEGR